MILSSFKGGGYNLSSSMDSLDKLAQNSSSINSIRTPPPTAASLNGNANNGPSSTATTAPKSESKHIEITPEMTEQLLLKLLLQQINLDKQKEASVASKTSMSTTTILAASKKSSSGDDLSSNTDSTTSSTHYSQQQQRSISNKPSNNKISNTNTTSINKSSPNTQQLKSVNISDGGCKSTSSMAAVSLSSSKLLQKSMSSFGGTIEDIASVSLGAPPPTAASITPPTTDYENPDETNYYSSPAHSSSNTSRDNKYFNYHSSNYNDTSSSNNSNLNVTSKFYKNRYY